MRRGGHGMPDMVHSALKWVRDDRLREVAKHLLLGEKHAQGLLEYFKPLDGAYFQRFAANPARELYALCVSRSYVLAQVDTRICLIGVDDDTGNLFINVVEEMPGRKVAGIPTAIRKIPLLVAEDVEVRRVLGYDSDYRDKPVDVHPGEVLRLRVQGDLVANVEGVLPGLEHFADDMVQENMEVLRDYADTLFADMVFGTLVEMGLTARFWSMHGRWRIEVEGVNHKRLKNALERRLARLFSNVVDEEPTRTSVYDQFFGHYALNYGGVAVDIEPQKRGAALSKLMFEAVKAFVEAGSKRSSASLMVGNHRVSVESCLPNSIAFNPSLQPAYLGAGRLTLSSSAIYALAGETTIKVTHPEHRSRWISFKQDAIVSFDMTAVSREFVRERNRLVLRLELEETPASDTFEEQEGE